MGFFINVAEFKGKIQPNLRFCDHYSSDDLESADELNASEEHPWRALRL